MPSTAQHMKPTACLFMKSCAACYLPDPCARLSCASNKAHRGDLAQGCNAFWSLRSVAANCINPIGGGCAGRFSWPSHVALSAEAKDLITKMLCVDVSKRITMAEIQVRSVFVPPNACRGGRHGCYILLCCIACTWKACYEQDLALRRPMLSFLWLMCIGSCPKSTCAGRTIRLRRALPSGPRCCERAGAPLVPEGPAAGGPR